MPIIVTRQNAKALSRIPMGNENGLKSKLSSYKKHQENVPQPKTI